MGDALDAMLTWLQASYGVGKATALALASPVLDLRVTQGPRVDGDGAVRPENKRADVEHLDVLAELGGQFGSP